MLALLCRGFEVWVYRWTPPIVSGALGRASVGVTTSRLPMPLDVLAQEVGNIDLIYEATGAAALSFDALRILGVNGVFVFTGVPGRKGPRNRRQPGDAQHGAENQLVFGTVNAGPDAFDAAIDDPRPSTNAGASL